MPAYYNEIDPKAAARQSREDAMADLNRATLIGRLGKDPEIRTTGNGDKIASFSLATMTLAANRLQRLAVNHPTGSREFIETSEWADEARAALKGADHG